MYTTCYGLYRRSMMPSTVFRTLLSIIWDFFFVSDLACSHRRAVELFTESIHSTCEFRSQRCPYDSINHNYCTRCEGDDCVSMGYHVNRTLRGTFYLTTAVERPFCMEWTDKHIIASWSTERIAQINKKWFRFMHAPCFFLERWQRWVFAYYLESSWVLAAEILFLAAVIRFCLLLSSYMSISSSSQLNHVSIVSKGADLMPT